MIDIREFHKSNNREFVALKDKVRNLVTHHAEDGAYKEAIVKNFLKRVLPEKYLIGTGFVIRNQTGEYGSHEDSKQLDIIIYEDSSPVIFKEGDFVILTPDSVLGIIEVKSNLYNAGLESVIRTANENGRFIYETRHNKNRRFFNGVFSFDGYQHGYNLESIQKAISTCSQELIDFPDFDRYCVNHISFDKDLFFKYWDGETFPHSIYKLIDLSFSFFIGNLVDYLNPETVGRNSFIWFASDKELNRIASFN